MVLNTALTPFQKCPQTYHKHVFKHGIKMPLTHCYNIFKNRGGLEECCEYVLKQ